MQTTALNFTTFRTWTIVLPIVCAMIGGRVGSAANITWDGDTSTTFSAGDNWIGGIAPALNSFTTDTAIFDGNPTTPFLPIVTTSGSLGGLSFAGTGTGGWTLGASSTSVRLTFANSTITSANTSGTNSIDTQLGIGAGGTGITFSIGSGGTLALSNTLVTTQNNQRGVAVNGGTLLVSSLDSTTGWGFNFNTGNGTTIIQGAARSGLTGTNTVTTGAVLIGNRSAFGSGVLVLNGGTFGTTTDLTGANAVANTVNYAVAGSGVIFGGTNSLELSGTFTSGGTNQSRALTNNISGAGKQLVLSGAVDLTSPLVATSAVKTLTFQGSGNTLVSGSIISTATTGNVTKSGAGTVTLSAANLYTGTTTVSGGVLRLNNANALPGGIGSTGGSSPLLINGGVVGLGAGNFARAAGTGAEQVNLSFGGFAAYGEDRSVNLGGNVTPSSLTWGSANFITTTGGPFVLGASDATHTLDFQNPISLATGVTVVTRTIRVDDGSAAVDGWLSGVISSTNANAAFVKTGAGTLLLTAANTYRGTTSVSEGRLLVNGIQTSATGALTVAAGATLGGDGSIGASLTTVDGVLTPGSSGTNTGLLTASALTLGAGSLTQIDITGTGARGVAFDGVNVTNALTYGGTLAFNMPTLVTGTFNIFDPGSSSGDLAAVSGVFGSFSPSWNLTSGTWSATLTSGTTATFSQGSGELVIVPEPATIALAGIGVAAAVYSLRRRQKRSDSTGG